MNMVDGFGDRNRPSWDIDRGCLDPLVEVRDGNDEIIVTADLPCVNKDNIEVFVEEGTLVIKAEMKRGIKFESWGGVHRKVSFNSFRKEIALPSRVEPEVSEAEFKRGVLKVTLKKKRGRSIEI